MSAQSGNDINPRADARGAVWNSLTRFDVGSYEDFGVGLGDRRRGRVPVWLLPVAVAACAAAWGIASGGERLRLVLLGALVWLLTLPLFAGLEAGLIALLLFEPLRGVTRRAQYLIVPYAQFDPMHLVTPLVTLFAVVAVVRSGRERMFTASPLAPAVSLLALAFVLQVFNPLQGSLFVGLSGALFFLVPVAWFYFGQAVRAEFLFTVLRLVALVGLVASLHGLYQLTVGYPSFEAYWLEHTEFYDSIAVGNVQRAVATFSSAEEWGRYVQTGAIAALGLGIGARVKSRRRAWLACAVTLALVLPLTGQRTAILGLVFGAGVFVLLGARDLKDAMGRAALMLAPVPLVFALSVPLGNDAVFDKGEDEKVGAMLTHATKGTLQPTQEDSLHERFKTWGYIATDILPYRPLGGGLGVATLGAQRFDQGGEQMPPIDSYFITIAVACGAPVALLLIWIVCRACSIAVRRSRELLRALDNQDMQSREAAALWRTVAALLLMLTLNNVFGMTFSLYSVAPLGWLLIGWTSAAAKRSGEGSLI